MHEAHHHERRTFPARREAFEKYGARLIFQSDTEIPGAESPQGFSVLDLVQIDYSLMKIWRQESRRAIIRYWNETYELGFSEARINEILTGIRNRLQTGAYLASVGHADSKMNDSIWNALILIEERERAWIEENRDLKIAIDVPENFLAENIGWIELKPKEAKKEAKTEEGKKGKAEKTEKKKKTRFMVSTQFQIGQWRWKLRARH